MGTRGPVPEPDNVRALRGMKPLRTPDGQKARRIVLPPKAPSPPQGLNRAAGAEWRRVCRELERAGVLAEVDRGILVAYVTAWAHMMEAEKILNRDGIVIESKRGDEGKVKNPAWQVYREANRTVVAAATQIFATPVARLRFPVAPGSAALGGGEAEGAWD
jgi:P27 family predicted phage terminase small subunit